MSFNIHLTNLWLFYIVAYAIAWPAQEWANRKRGEPFDDPEFLFRTKHIFAIAMIWLVSGLAISFFVPVRSGFLFYAGLFFYICGMVIAVSALYSFACQKGLATRGIHRYSRNPGYVGWTFVMLGMSVMGLSASIWSVLFLAYFVLTIPYFHWTVLLEEKFLVGKFGASYSEYLKKSPRYFGKRAPRLRRD